MLAHNGEINTVQGNENWMRAREGVMHSEQLPDLERAFPICTPGSSDTARFDEALELLNLAGRPLHHAILMMIPEAWENHESMDAERKAFYRYHSALMEPWDGPASIAFTDGTVIGAVLDRNGLRPSRYWVTDDDRVIMASEVGVLDVAPEKIGARSSSTLGRVASSPTTRSRPSSRRCIRIRSGSTTVSCISTTCRRSSRSCRSTARPCSSNACSATRRKTCA